MGRDPTERLRTMISSSDPFSDDDAPDASLRVVTIDGPAASGKGTVARQLADTLGWTLLNTGAMYRVVALAGMRRGLDLTDEDRLAALAGTLKARFEVGRAWLDDEDVTEPIHSIEVTRATRHAADNLRVRAVLVGWQRRFARCHHPIVTEGRDQGTVVFPNAPVKIYLTADPAERARRRVAQFTRQGQTVDPAQVFADLLQRDREDESRPIGALKPAPDALRVDTTNLAPREIVGDLAILVRQRLGMSNATSPKIM